MKNKAILLVAASAIITLSFTFSSVHSTNKEKDVITEKQVKNEPIGGFVSEDKF